MWDKAKDTIVYHSLTTTQDESQDDLDALVKPHLHNRWHQTILVGIVVAQAILSVVLIGAGLSEYWRRSPRSRLFPTALYSPAQDVLEYEVKRFHSGFHTNRSIYQGPPSEALDAAWEDLYSFGVTSVPKHQAARMPNLTVPIPDEPGHFIIELDVFHELHCLNMVRKTFYPDYYPAMNPKPDGEDAFFGFSHIDHCIDSIRQSLMCMADISTIIYTWSETYNMSLPVGQVVHTCRNFEKIQAWAKERQVAHFDAKTYVKNDLDIPDF